MSKIRFALGFLSVFSLLASSTVLAEEVKFKIDPDKTVHQIDEKVYGHFLEHIYHSVNGGLWGELVWNRSFEDVDAGQWKSASGVVSQSGMGENQRLTFGDTAWTDFEYTVEAKKTGGNEGFLILFRTKNDKEFYWVNLGGWGNKRHGIERRNEKQDRQSMIGHAVDGQIEKDRWYKIRVRCEGPKIEVFLDDQKILQQVDDGGPKNGQCGIGTWATKAEFRNIQVKSLDGKVLFDELPKISEKEQVGKHWETFGNATAYLESKKPLNGNFYQRLVLIGGNEKAKGGIQQKGFSLKKGERYLVSFWVKHDPLSQSDIMPEGSGIYFYFKDGKRGTTTYRSYSKEWEEIRFEFDCRYDNDNSTLQLEFEIPAGRMGSVCIDQISVMPLSWKENFGGMRPDLLNAIADLRPPTIRWPGGCFASAYRWKSGIGAQHERIPYPFSIWNDREINSFGTDEFIELCRRVGSEPILVVNAGTPPWNKERNPDLANVDWPQEAAEWVEYCNGPATSKWGKVRAAGGHPAPYNVKYWEIDNETQGANKVEDYIGMIKKMVPAMKAVDPSIKIAVAGSHFGPREPWDGPIIEQVGDLFDYLSFHQYDDPNKYANGPDEIGKYFQKLKGMIQKSKNPNIKIFDSEWNAQSTDWRTGLYAGAMLNMFERNGDIVGIGGPALFLRHTSATDWDNAFVNFDQTGWFPAPNYVVMKLWRDHYAPNLLELSGDTTKINAVATKSDDGKTLYFKAVNPTRESKDVVLTVPGESKRKVVFQRIGAEELSTRNTLENPTKIMVKPADAKIDGDTVRFVMPPLSAGVLQINQE